ncbi:MAG: hydroxymethylglutaryl-CoA reductase, degradative [Bdellovibrionales bacterium]|nr:hydroxymethylglutaryl-CoA reductase, degradative [Bdellovibrionales bacterium]
MADQRVENEMKELFSGFSKLDRKDRLHRLVKMGALTAKDVEFLNQGSPLSTDLAEKFIENVIGYYQMPLGVVANMVIDGRAYAIPMSVEETSIVAAASKTAKWIRERGTLTTEVVGNTVIGQIQIAKVKNWDLLESVFEFRKKEWIDLVNSDVAKGLVARGGGVQSLSLRQLDRPDGELMGVLHVYVDACDAMGANVVNQICEFLKPEIEVATGEEVTMCILSNLVDSKVTKAKLVIRDVDPEMGEKIAEGSLFAQLDPYRATTNNKGVLNGIDPILLATGNDWRAVEAGVHAYAARDGQYRSITRWTWNGTELVGEFEAPICVGIVGGVTRLHPTAKMALRMLGVESANHLSRICAAVGLVQNLGALKALTSVGIIEGHMKLHISNLTMGAGATEAETPILQKRLEEILRLTRRISLNNAIDVLKEMRQSNVHNLASHK